MAKGSITRLEQVPKKRCRKWKLRYRKDGHDRTRRFSGTYSQAQAALEEFVAEVDSEEARPAADVTFGEYAEAWVARREAARQIEPSTAATYRSNLARTKGTLWDMRLGDVARSDVVAMLGSIVSEGGMSNTAKHTLVTASQVLREAVLDGAIASNPAEGVRPPKNDQREKSALGTEQVRSLADAMESGPPTAAKTGVLLALLLGLRVGEACGLEWGDVRGGAVHVRRSYCNTTGKIKGPKSTAGVRTVPLPAELAAHLGRWREAQRAQLEAAGACQRDDTPVLTTARGARLRSGTLGEWWRCHRGDYGVSCTFHELRHTYLTVLANSGASMRSLKSIAGWASLSMADTYVHDDERANARAVEAMERHISGCADGTCGTPPQSGASGRK